MDVHTKAFPTRGDLAREQLRRRGVAYWGDVLEDLRARLGELSADARAAFAAACAERLVRAHEARPADAREATLACRPLLDGMWARLGLAVDSQPVTDLELDAFEAASADEDEDTDDPADDAHHAAIYAARCMRTGAVAEAVWAAGRAVDVALGVAADDLGLDEDKFAWDPAADPPMPAVRHAMHASVQATLSRLVADLDVLEREGPSEATLRTLRA